MQEQQWMTVADAAKALGLCKNTVRKYAHSGELKCWHAGNRMRFDLLDVQAFKWRRSQQKEVVDAEA